MVPGGLMDEREITGGEAAAHLAMNASTEEAREYLREQTRLARLQSEQIEEENLTRRRMLKLEHTSAMFKLSLELAVAAVITIAAIAFGAALWSAATDNGLVVESFAVPPDLAGRGADRRRRRRASLLDKLQMLQGATQSNRAPSSYANNWGSDIKVQIPDTGVSIGEFVRLLHTWLGHQTRISGEIWRTTNGIAVTARAGSDTSPTFTGTDADLDKLIQKAAESVYRATQPYRYAVYLANVGRIKEAQAAYESLIAKGSDQDRAWAYVGLENSYTDDGDFVKGRQALENALAAKPGFIMALHQSGRHREPAPARRGAACAGAQDRRAHAGSARSRHRRGRVGAYRVHHAKPVRRLARRLHGAGRGRPAAPGPSRVPRPSREQPQQRPRDMGFPSRRRGHARRLCAPAADVEPGHAAAARGQPFRRRAAARKSAAHHRAQTQIRGLLQELRDSRAPSRRDASSGRSSPRRWR